MRTLRVTLFGEVAVERGGRGVKFASAKAVELFAYLLIHRDRAHRREALAEILWPGDPLKSSKRYLRQALWKLNSADTDMPIAVAVDSASLRLNSHTVAWADVVQFDEAYAAVRATPGAALTPRQAAALRQAVGLYGDGLPSLRFQEWARPEAERFRQTYLAMLEQLMEYSEARGEYAEGLRDGRTVLRLDPARETSHRRLMALHDRSGDRTAAIRQYHLCAEALAREFDVRPSPETVALYRRLSRAGEPPAAPVPATIPLPSSEPDAASLSALRLRLETIQTTLASLYAAIDQTTDRR